MNIHEKNILIERYCNTVACNECLITGYCNDCKGKWLSYEEITDKAVKVITENNKEMINDPINPAHYKDGKIEVIEFIEDKKLGYCLGNAVKYIARAGKKDPTKEVEDLKKAEWYVKRRIKELEEVTND